MAMLEVPDVFTMLVPDGWTATRSDGTYELTRPGDDGAAHVSVYERDGRPLSDEEIDGVVAQFVARTGVSEMPAITVLNEGRSQRRAVTHFTAEADGQVLGWVVFAVIWPDHLLLCSCTAGPSSPMLAESERMFASIFKPKRRLFRRG
ncbi:hypothetical protein [Nocardioides jejuensis]|uniref:DUF1795 domain-containing protein n=1 Tax=Nocardioides jejuensis TaxID=2502782 RepID=A0A4V6NBF5_9ACTN|nr:hypothetical protein [Nocardioides jejuensis]TCJ30592.1 hypothetical protein EPD65_03230 [Nocardioides jejuensis]